MLPLELLPGPAQALIASMLPDGDFSGNRPRLSETSRSLLSFHGGTLTALRVPKREQYSHASLASLLGHQRNLERVIVEGLEVLPMLAPSIQQS
jgi:hypothetical protein